MDFSSEAAVSAKNYIYKSEGLRGSQYWNCSVFRGEGGEGEKAYLFVHYPFPHGAPFQPFIVTTLTFGHSNYSQYFTYRMISPSCFDLLHPQHISWRGGGGSISPSPPSLEASASRCRSGAASNCRGGPCSQPSVRVRLATGGLSPPELSCDRPLSPSGVSEQNPEIYI